MKFLVTAGKKKGLSFEVRDAEITIGRRQDNQIVLDDESVSSHHAKIYKDGDDLVVEDCNSVNGIEVNGSATKKEILRSGDVVAIGSTQIKVVADEHKALKKKDEKGKGGALKFVAATLLVLAVCGVGVVVFLKKGKGRVNAFGEGNPSVYTKGVFRIKWEKIRASNQNIFRYEFRIENNSLYVSIDDLKQGRHEAPSKPITPEQIKNIQDELHEQQLFNVESLEGKADVWDCDTIHLVSRGEAKTIRILNRVPPDNFKAIASYLEKFAENELGIVSAAMSVEELKARAQKAFIRARKLFDERFVTVGNLYAAIKSYQETIWYLNGVEPKPEIYAQAIHGKEVAMEELNKALEEHNFKATRAISLKEWKKAREELLQVLQKLPDTSDKRNQDAKTRLLDVEKRLQTR